MNRKIKKLLNLKKEFGIKVAFLMSLYNITKNDDKYIQTILTTLKDIFYKEIECAQEYGISSTTEIPTKKIIWTFWWQGSEDLPEILQLCKKGHEKYIDMDSFEYIFITRDNYMNYVQIPEMIIEKMNKGIISITHFSDLLRVSLIEKYGGAWIDITMLITDSIPKEVFEYPFYSVNLQGSHEPSDIGQKVSECRWASFLYASNKPGNPVFLYLKNIVTSYWEKYNYPIDYFFMNFFLRLGYEYIDEIKREIDLVPASNHDLYKLQPIINDIGKKDELLKIMSSDTCFYKLTQKKEAHKYVGEEQTIYGQLLDYYKVNG